MPDFRAEIPTRSFINALIIEEAVETRSFQDCVQQTLSKIRLPIAEYQFVNPAHLVGLLYCLVVVPKEIWLLPQNHILYKRLKEEAELEKLFSITLRDPKFDSDPVYYLMHRLRNAIAHANFSIDESQAFEFWDGPGKNEPANWKASITSLNLLKFVNWLGRHWETLPKSRPNAG